MTIVGLTAYKKGLRGLSVHSFYKKEKRDTWEKTQNAGISDIMGGGTDGHQKHDGFRIREKRGRRYRRKLRARLWGKGGKKNRKRDVLLRGESSRLGRHCRVDPKGKREVPFSTWWGGGEKSGGEQDGVLKS